MPMLELRDVRIRYEISGPREAPTILLSNSLGTNLEMWNSQVPVLSRKFCVLRYDMRGHGQSTVTPGPYTIEQLAQDVLLLLDHLNIEKTHFCGLSMSGLIGMLLALRNPQRLRHLILCNTSPKIANAEIWNTRIETVRKSGMAAIIDGVIQRWFTPTFQAASPAAIESTRKVLLDTPVEGYAACCAAIRDIDLRDSIAGIQVPTLVITGTSDPVTPPSESRLFAERIAGAQYKELPAAHLSNIEAAEAFTMELLNFLKA
jgi:3-oxoadipate enol-lactonase